MRLFVIRSLGELLAIAGGVQIGVPRFAEGNFASLDAAHGHHRCSPMAFGAKRMI